MRVLRVIAAVVWIVSSFLLVVVLLLCVSILLLPVGLLLGLVVLRLYGMGLRLLHPRSRDIDKSVRRKARRWWGKSPLRELAPKRGRKTRPGSAREFVRRVGLGAPSLDYGWPLWVALMITSVVVRRNALCGGVFYASNGINSSLTDGLACS